MLTPKLIEILTIIASVTTIALIIMNQPQTGDTFGSKGGIMQTRRGFEKFLYRFTIFLGMLFIVSSVFVILK
jgi:protein translocase SecG subunit